jgi:hypothetical protein
MLSGTVASLAGARFYWEAAMLGTILLVFAFVFAAIAALFVDSVNRPPIVISFGWLALAFYLLSILLGGKFG